MHLIWLSAAGALLLRMGRQDARLHRIPGRLCLLLLLWGILMQRGEPEILAARLLQGICLLLAAACWHRASGGFGLGGGDWKWMAAVCACLGIWDALRALLWACILAILRRPPEGERGEFAFGPFLALSTGFWLLVRYFWFK